MKTAKVLARETGWALYQQNVVAIHFCTAEVFARMTILMNNPMPGICIYGIITQIESRVLGVMAGQSQFWHSCIRDDRIMFHNVHVGNFKGRHFIRK